MATVVERSSSKLSTRTTCLGTAVLEWDTEQSTHLGELDVAPSTAGEVSARR